MSIVRQLFSVVAVMVNLMCQLSWIMVPRDLVKHNSGYFCEGVFWMELNFMSVDVE